MPILEAKSRPRKCSLKRLIQGRTIWPVEPKSCNQRRRKKCRLYPFGHPADWLRLRKIWLRLRTKSRIGQNPEFDQTSNVEKCNSLSQLSIIYFLISSLN